MNPINFVWKKIKPYLLHLAWLMAFVSLVGSLFFSEVMKLPPCVLCWYQRIFMYPLVAVIAVGMIRKDKNLPYYVLPLSVPGLLLALYHTLLQWRILPEVITCTAGVPCALQQLNLFGFVNIPFLSLLAFVIITACMVCLIMEKWQKKQLKR